MSGIRNAIFASFDDLPSELLGAFVEQAAAETITVITDRAAANDLTERCFTGISRSSGG
ncbi:hypothetical protein SBADM41S_01743 [Streptomyces badius]